MPLPSDAFDILKSADPVDEAALPGPESAHGARLLAEILATPRWEPVRAGRRRSRRSLVAAVGVAVLSIATLAAAWIVFRPVTDPVAVTCYQDVSLEASAIGVAAGGQLDPDLCQNEWRSGRLANAGLAEPGTTPPLTACLLPTGSLAVLPTDDAAICDKLGLKRPDPASLPPAHAMRAVQQQLVEYFAAGVCVDMATARAEVERVLISAGLGEWTIVATPPTADRPCASVSLDAPARTAHLVPVPPTS